MIDYRNFSNVTNSFDVDEEKIETVDEETIEELDAEEAEVADFDDDTMATGVVDRDKIYLRHDPSKDALSLDVLERDEELLIDFSKSTDEWYNVCTATGQEGYVMKELLKVE